VTALAAVPLQARPSSPERYAERLYERHSRAVYGFCVKQLRSRDEAEDALQTTFIYALLSLRRGVVPEYELPWLLTIARNACSTRRRSGRRRGAHESPHDLELLQDRLATPDRSDSATSADFQAALDMLPERQRLALLLREWRGLSYDEIGRELGLSQAATEALLFRARQNAAERLRAALKALQGWPVFSFLRRLAEAGAAKTIAVGAGAALTVALVPAAQPPSRAVARTPAPPSGVASALGDVGTAPVSAPRPTSPPARRQAAGVRGDVSHSHSVASGPSRPTPVAPTAQSAAVTPPPAAVTTPPTTSSPEPSERGVPTVTEPLGRAVDVASDAAPDVPALPNVSVSLPELTTPSLPVEAPELPSTNVEVP
jgi:RNA polymerase sigma-70 factor, ECF subfamily